MITHKKKITVSEIARESGVSPATVSRVLNHPDLVKEDTLRLVENTMQALGHTPVIKNRTPNSINQPIIVLNLSDIDNAFYTEIIKGATVSANAHGCYLLINQIPISSHTIADYCNLLKRVNAIGTILLTQLSTDLLSRINSLAPVVQCCEFNPDAPFPYISIDDRKAAQRATEHLIACGRNKIAFINGPRSYKYASERKLGFLDALNNADLSCPPNWVIQLPEVNYDMAFAATSQLLNSDNIPNAFFVISDAFAAAVIKAAKRYHYNVPRDIMVVGFDNIPLAYMFSPSITTINQPKFQEGYSACEMLLEIAGNPEASPKSILLDTELIIRESTSFIPNTFK